MEASQAFETLVLGNVRANGYNVAAAFPAKIMAALYEGVIAHQKQKGFRAISEELYIDGDRWILQTDPSGKKIIVTHYENDQHKAIAMQKVTGLQVELAPALADASINLDGWDPSQPGYETWVATKEKGEHRAKEIQSELAAIYALIDEPREVTTFTILITDLLGATLIWQSTCMSESSVVIDPPQEVTETAEEIEELEKLASQTPTSGSAISLESPSQRTSTFSPLAAQMIESATMPTPPSAEELATRERLAALSKANEPSSPSQSERPPTGSQSTGSETAPSLNATGTDQAGQQIHETKTGIPASRPIAMAPPSVERLGDEYSSRRPTSGAKSSKAQGMTNTGAKKHKRS